MGNISEYMSMGKWDEKVSEWLLGALAYGNNKEFEFKFKCKGKPL